MRSPVVLALAAATLVALSASGPQPARAAVVINPGPIRTLAPWVEITGFERAPYDPAHPDWLRYSVAITNTSQTAGATGTLLFQNTSTLVEGTAPFSVAAGQTVDVLFEDNETSLACVGRTFDLWLDGTGSDAKVRIGTLDTACTFAAPIQDSLLLLTPDMRSRYRAGHVSLANASTSNVGCGGLTFEADVVNETAVAQASLAISFGETGPLGGGFAAVSAVPAVGPGQLVHVKVTLPEFPASATFQVFDQAHTAPITSQSISLSEQESCTAFTQLW
jgi:hypothetical protein